MKTFRWSMPAPPQSTAEKREARRYAAKRHRKRDPAGEHESKIWLAAFNIVVGGFFLYFTIDLPMAGLFVTGVFMCFSGLWLLWDCMSPCEEPAEMVPIEGEPEPKSTWESLKDIALACGLGWLCYSVLQWLFPNGGVIYEFAAALVGFFIGAVIYWKERIKQSAPKPVRNLAETVSEQTGGKYGYNRE